MLALLHHELKYYFKNIQEAIYIYGLFISIILLAPFGFHGGAAALSGVAIPILWIALMTATSLGAMNLFARDAATGRLAYYQLLPVSLERLVFAKWLAFYLFISLPLVLILPLALLLLAIPIPQWGQVFIGLAAGAAALTAIAALASVLMAGLQKAGAVLALLILPLSIPVMIFGSSYCDTVGALWQPSLVFLIGFAAFLLPIYVIAGASSIRASH